MRKLLSGNEAIAEALYEAGVKVAAGYPGTPSSEIMMNLVAHPEVHSEWCPNEKVALEVAFGASVAGTRSVAVMKHVGLNVAADPFFTFAYVGVTGGCVVITADDPGMHSSQNEQDNRHYARAAKVPMLEPTDSQEAHDLMLRAYDISERYDTPVLYRTTTRIAHSKTPVELGARTEHAKVVEHQRAKYVMVPGNAKARHKLIEERLPRLRELSNELNTIEWRGKDVGIIADGVAYQYAREVFPDASTLKLKMSHPLPDARIRELAAAVKQLYVVEELDPFIEDQVRAMGISCVGKDKLPLLGELSPEVVAKALLGTDKARKVEGLPELPPRPPVLCPGCPHRGIFLVLAKRDIFVYGDIGCYTLSSAPPISAMDTCLCMGASIGGAHGMDKALGEERKGRVVGVIGDSTFIHSGITGLLNVVYNRGMSTIIILDNRTTAMTGGQNHPGTGLTLMGEPTHRLDIEALAKALGIKLVHHFDPYDLEATGAALDKAFAHKGPTVLITTRPCVLAPSRITGDHVAASDKGACRRCAACLKIGCPAISKVSPGTDGKKFDVVVAEDLCVGCDVCVQVCKFDAMRRSPR